MSALRTRRPRPGNHVPLVSKRDIQIARAMLETIDDPTCVVDDDGVVVVVNTAWSAVVLDVAAAEIIAPVGTSYLDCCDVATARAGPAGDAAEVARGVRLVLAGGQDRFAHEYARASTSDPRWTSAQVSSFAIDRRRGAVISLVDSSRLHAAQASVAFHLRHDSLTGLPNRESLTDHLQAGLDRAEGGDGPAVTVIGVDGFKRINNGLGPQRGDEVLVATANRLGRAVRPEDKLARFASDEFAVVWGGLPTSAEAVDLTVGLIEVLRRPFDLNGAIVTLTASGGLVVPAASDSAGDVLAQANSAMREAKRRGGDRVREYTEAIADSCARRLDLESELRTALDRSELVLHYQPIVDIATGVPSKVEALLRWTSADRGVIAPDEFIPIAESSGLILALGKWVLAQACRDAAAFTGAAERLPVTVNLSARQLTDPAIVDYVRSALADSGLAPERLFLEVTESSLMQDEDMAEAALKELTQLGVRVAIDDFGTGYSSLLYLRRYPVSMLKIDREFVSGIGFSVDDEAICHGIVGLATWMGLDAVAEGVETPEQARALGAFGCGFGQGYLWSPAVPIEGLSQALAACVSAPRYHLELAEGVAS